ncbi:MAG: 50S ribosomal protein L9 [Desulfobacteraceae bacterium]|nr:MAG: 50S ribosomal protein L9 [Desulfobacteraceae bacterium]
MKVILKLDKDDLGFEGDVINVSKGYARNFLIPQGIALEATDGNAKMIEARRAKIEVRKVKAQEEADRLKEKLNGLEITIAQKVGEEEKLYGSVTTMDIAERLEKQGVVVDRHKLILEKPIKTLGTFEVSMKINPKTTAKIKVIVVPEQQ